MLTIDEIEVLERDAKDEYVDEYGVGSYSPEVTKLCADWRELQAQVESRLTTIQELRDRCDEWKAKNDWQTVDLLHFRAERDLLKAEVAELKKERDIFKFGYLKAEKKVATLMTNMAELTTEQEKAYAALADVGEFLQDQDWVMSDDTRQWIKESLEAKREIDADDRRSLDLFDA